jgi:antitoxin VapB
MDNHLTIDSEVACELAEHLASLTGESVSNAVTKALRAELERQQNEADLKAELARMMAAARELRAHIKGPISSDTSDLYDENGLPL